MDVLSVVAQQIQTIHAAVVSEVKTFEFEGAELTLNGSCSMWVGWFILLTYLCILFTISMSLWILIFVIIFQICYPDTNFGWRFETWYSRQLEIVFSTGCHDYSRCAACSWSITLLYGFYQGILLWLKYFSPLAFIHQSDLHSTVLHSSQIFLIVHVFVEEAAWDISTIFRAAICSEPLWFRPSSC